MNKLVAVALVSLPVIAGGLAYANAQKPAPKQVQNENTEGYICPATGEELPCQSCCPLNK